METAITEAGSPAAASASASSGNAGTAERRGEGVALFLILLLALALRLHGLAQNGWGAEYYSAAVRSMAMSWHNFFYCAFDPEGFISVDKPPVALWLQVASVKLFGYRPLSVLVPQALAGAASVWVLFRLVRRRFSAAAALLAALFFAVTPVFVAVNRTNNTDSCLVLVLLLAAWALLKAAEMGSRPVLLLSMALIGLAFNTKMLAACIVLPTFVLAYFLGAQQERRRRVIDLALAAVVLAATSLPWVLACELTPADRRPFTGGSARNSVLELVVGYNGIGRFISPVKPPEAAGNDPEGAQGAGLREDRPAGAGAAAVRRPPAALARLFVHAPPGLLRLADGQLLAQAGWLLPLAAAALILGAGQGRPRVPLDPVRISLLFWFCWIATYFVVYSSAGGIMHFYYLATLAPALAALAGIGAACLWSAHRRQDSRGLVLPAVLLLTALWEFSIQLGALGWPVAALWERPGDWLGGIHAALAGGTAVSAAGLFFCSRRPAASRLVPALARGSLAIGLAALLVLPAAWALSSVLVPGQGVLPSADLTRLESLRSRGDSRVLGRFGRTADTARLVDFLKANRTGERFLLATSTAPSAAPIIIGTGEAVLARGGFHGLDPAVSPERLARMVAAKEVRFVMLGDVAAVSRRMGADAAGRPVADWVRAHGRLVDPGLWRRSPRSRSRVELYDLRPDAGLVAASPR